MSRVLLIQPPFYRFIGIRARYFPYHLVCLGTFLQNNGHEVRIIEGDKGSQYGSLRFTNLESSYGRYLQSLRHYDDPFWNVLGDSLESFKPDIIGITVWTTFIASAIHTARYCRKNLPEVCIVAGGPHATLVPDDLLKAEVFDVVVRGEGERALLELAGGEGRRTVPQGQSAMGGSMYSLEERPYEPDLDSFGMPDRSLLSGNDGYDQEDYGLIMTSRGCPYACSYCATTIWKNRVRYRSLASVIDEMQSVKDAYGTIYFTIKDDSFTINRKRVVDFCRQLTERRLRVAWECNANIRDIDESLLHEMKSAGCVAIKVGVETGSERIHKVINKRICNALVREKMKEIRKVGLHTTCYFMMGIPGETKEDILSTLKFAREIRPDYISMSAYEIFPGTELFKAGVNEGSTVEKMTIEDYFSVCPQNYYFKGQKRHLRGMSQDDYDALEAHVKKQTDKYNRSARQVYRRIRSRATIYRKNCSYIVRDAKKFLHWF